MSPTEPRTATNNDIREMRELLIELRINLHHLNTRVDNTLQELHNKVSKIEERMFTYEKQQWTTVGAMGIISILVTYILRWFFEQ